MPCQFTVFPSTKSRRCGHNTNSLNVLQPSGRHSCPISWIPMIWFARGGHRHKVFKKSHSASDLPIATVEFHPCNPATMCTILDRIGRTPKSLRLHTAFEFSAASAGSQNDRSLRLRLRRLQRLCACACVRVLVCFFCVRACVCECVGFYLFAQKERCRGSARERYSRSRSP